MDIERARFNMIEQQIRPWDVLDPAVLEALAIVKREDFVPPEYQALAFVDTEVPLPNGQCMLAPKLEARLMQEATIRPHEHVLEIGSGSGHMAALLAQRAAHVTTIEIDPELAQLATGNLRRTGVGNVTVLTGDASRALPEGPPFDAILLSGSVQEIPGALLARLATGGRLVGIVGELPIMRAVLVTRAEEGVASVDLFETVAPRLKNFGERTRFVF